MQRRFWHRGLVLCGIAFLTLGFQNCESNTSQDIGSGDNKVLETEQLNCAVPWHDSLRVLNGKSVIAFASESVAEGETCQQEERICSDGNLSGSFAFGSCQVLASSAQDCSVPWDDGLVVRDGSGVRAFQLNADGSACNEETRTCSAGTLSGSFTLGACPAVGKASCELPWGETLKEGTTVKVKDAKGTPFKDADCGLYVQYTCKDDKLTVAAKEKACPNEKPCTLPWGGAINHKQSVNAYKYAEEKSGATCSGANVEKRTCNNGKLSGSFKNKSCKAKETPKQECKVHFKSGASAATQVKNEAECLSYYAQIKANNPSQVIVKLTLGKKELKLPKEEVTGTILINKIVGGKKTKVFSAGGATLTHARLACRLESVKDDSAGYECLFNGLLFQKIEEPKAQTCKIAFQGGGSISSQQKSVSKCEAYWAEVKKNNPQNVIAKVTFGSKVLYTAPVTVATKVCKITFKSGASASTKVKDRGACEKYHAEIKKNNPQQEIRSVTFDGQVIYMNTSDMGTLIIKITKNGKTDAMGLADVTEASAKTQCENAIKKNPGAGVRCEFKGKVLREVKETVVTKVCKITFASGASASTKVKDRAACEKYHAEIKKNNPKQKISSVTFDGKKL